MANAPGRATGARSARRSLALVADFETVEVAEFLITAIDVDRAQGARRAPRCATTSWAAAGGVARRVRGALAAWAGAAARTAPGASSSGRRPSTSAAAPRLRSSPRSTEAALRAEPTPSAASSPRASTPGSPPSTRCSPATRTATTASRSGMPTATASTTSTSPSPSGLPNRLYRNRGDGTFEDVTERAGLGVLDDTSQVALRRRRQRRRPGPGPRHERGARAVPERREGSLHPRPRRLPLQGGALRARPCRWRWPTTTATASSTSTSAPIPSTIGASEDKAGTPMPYHDAQNGPPERPLPERRPRALRGRDPRSGPRREQRPLPLRRRLGRLRRRRLARPAGGQRLRTEEPLPQPRACRTGR